MTASKRDLWRRSNWRVVTPPRLVLFCTMDYLARWMSTATATDISHTPRQLYNPSKKKWGNPGTPLFRDLTPLVDFWDPQPNNCGATVGGGYGHWRSTAKKKLRPVRLQGIYSYIFIFLRTALFLCSCWYSLIGNPDFCTQKCQGGQHK